MEQCELKTTKKKLERGSVMFKYWTTLFLLKCKNVWFCFLHETLFQVKLIKKKKKALLLLLLLLIHTNGYGLCFLKASLIQHSLHVKGTTVLAYGDCNTARCDIANRPVDLKLPMKSTKLNGQDSALKHNIFQSQGLS